MKCLMGLERGSLLSALRQHGNSAIVESSRSPLGITEQDGAAIVLRNNFGSNMFSSQAPNRASTDPQINAVGIDRLDLDTLTGVLAVLGEKPDSSEARGFFDAMTDLARSPGRSIEHINCSETIRQQLYAGMYELERGFGMQLQLTRRDEVRDITPHIEKAREMLNLVIAKDPTLMSRGEEYRQRLSAMSTNTFVNYARGVLSRAAAEDVSRLFSIPSLPGEPGGQLARALVTYQTGIPGTITLALSAPIERVDCLQIAETLWGPTSTGSATYAQSPSNRRMTEDQFSDAAARMRTEMDTHPVSSR